MAQNKYRNRCEDCTSCDKKTWLCMELLVPRKVEEIEADECPFEIGFDEQDELDDKAKKVKILKGAKSDTPTKPRKPRTYNAPQGKVELFNFLTKSLEEGGLDFRIEKPNKLIIIEVNGETYKLDLIAQRKKKEG